MPTNVKVGSPQWNAAVAKFSQSLPGQGKKETLKLDAGAIWNGYVTKNVQQLLIEKLYGQAVATVKHKEIAQMRLDERARDPAVGAHADFITQLDHRIRDLTEYVDKKEAKLQKILDQAPITRIGRARQERKITRLDAKIEQQDAAIKHLKLERKKEVNLLINSFSLPLTLPLTYRQEQALDVALAQKPDLIEKVSKQMTLLRESGAIAQIRSQAQAFVDELDGHDERLSGQVPFFTLDAGSISSTDDFESARSSWRESVWSDGEPELVTPDNPIRFNI